MQAKNNERGSRGVYKRVRFGGMGVSLWRASQQNGPYTEIATGQHILLQLQLDRDNVEYDIAIAQVVVQRRRRKRF